MNGQCAQILAILRAANGGWVSAPELAKFSLQYNARIFEARALGFQIENRTIMRGRKKYGFFRLLPQAPRLQLTVEESERMKAALASINQRSEATPTLFANEKLHRDDG